MAPRRAPSFALALSFAAHAVLFALWRVGMSPQAPSMQYSREIELRLLPPEYKKPSVAISGERQSTLQPKAIQPQTALSAVTGNPDIPAAPKPLDPDPSLSRRMPDAQELLLSAKRDAGRIDRELRGVYPARAELMPAAPDSLSARLGKGMSSAAIARTTTMQEFSTADGRRYTKVTTSGSTYCVWARDANQSAATIGTAGDFNIRMTNCPN